MELHHLSYVVAVAEERSFTRAAKRLRVAQPGVSAQIRRLEEELGEELFDRSGRSVQLTAVGEAFLPHARAALEAVARARQAVEALHGLLEGTVTVGMLPSASFHDVDLPALLARFREQYPHVSISLSESRADQLLLDVRRGCVDLAVVALAGEIPEGIDGLMLRDDRMGAAVAKGDILANESEIQLDQLRQQILICLPKGSGIRAVLDAACAQAGFEAPVALEASDPSVVAQLASRGLGVAVLPESIIRAFPRALHPLRITGAELRGRVVLAWRTGGPINPAGRALIAMAQDTFRSLETVRE